MNWFNAITGFRNFPVNYPLHFLRDLFMISLVAPIMWMFLRHRVTGYVGLLLLLLVYYYDLDRLYVLTNDMYITFYLGGIAAARNWNLKCLDRFAKWIAALLIVICIVIVQYKLIHKDAFVLLSPLLVWPSMSLIMNTRLGNALNRYASCSFFVYVVHAPVILTLWLVYQSISIEMPYALYWCASPILAAGLCVLANMGLSRFTPRLAEWVSGGR